MIAYGVNTGFWGQDPFLIAEISAAERCGLAGLKPGDETSCRMAAESCSAERFSTDMTVMIVEKMRETWPIYIGKPWAAHRRNFLVFLSTFKVQQSEQLRS